jgi:hypothetical protein
MTHFLCRNELAIERLQREMFRLARDELLVETDVCDTKISISSNSSSIDASGNDMGFYYHNFGLTMVERREDLESKQKNATNTLVYYRIWKNANDNIRRIMFHYSSLNDFTVDVGPCETIDTSCIKSMNMRYPRVNLASGSIFGMVFPSKHLLDRFPFTFVRNPIDRFISGDLIFFSFCF